LKPLGRPDDGGIVIQEMLAARALARTVGASPCRCVDDEDTV
jgi:hypothetical protein